MVGSVVESLFRTVKAHDVCKTYLTFWQHTCTFVMDMQESIN